VVLATKEVVIQTIYACSMLPFAFRPHYPIAEIAKRLRRGRGWRGK
jgi:hypothetical protein